PLIQPDNKVNQLLTQFKTISKKYMDRGPYSYWRHSYWPHAKFIHNYAAQIEQDLLNETIKPCDAAHMTKFLYEFMLEKLHGKTSSLKDDLYGLKKQIDGLSEASISPKQNHTALQAHINLIKGCYRFTKRQQYFSWTSR